MKRLFLLTIFAVQLYGCADRQQSDKQDKTVLLDSKADTLKIIYADSGQSSFKILSGDTNSGYDFKTVEINYKLVYIAPHGYSTLNHYFAKYTTTSKTCTGCEGQERTIKVELNTFNNPNKTELTIEKDCDDVTLGVHTYKTVKYGCCANEDELAIYDYDKKLIIEGDSKILLGRIPNSHIKLFTAWKNGGKDTTILGTLYFCYSSADKYAIKIKGTLPPDSCSPFSPDILIYTGNSDDKFHKDNNEYSLWSLNKIESKDKINNLTLKVAFWCDSELNIDTLAIPIINGRPFGKNDKQQFISLRQK